AIRALVLSVCSSASSCSAARDIAGLYLVRDRAENCYEARIDAWIIRDLRGHDCVPCAMRRQQLTRVRGWSQPRQLQRTRNPQAAGACAIMDDQTRRIRPKQNAQREIIQAIARAHSRRQPCGIEHTQIPFDLARLTAEVRRSMKPYNVTWFGAT